MKPVETILIIDDEASLRMNLRALLEDLGYQISEAANGLEGLETCAAIQPDLILLDVRMPGMDGFEVCSRLKAEEASREIPVIFLSGMLDALDKVRAFQVGGVDFVTKPFHIEEVEARVRTHLELLRQRKRLEEQNKALQQSLQDTETLNRKLIEVNERIRQSEALKGQFLSTMRNEINNPLNAILALGTELERGEIPAERSRMIGGLIAAEASALDFQIRNIFCAAELEAGEALPSITRVDAGSVVRDVIDSLRYQARQKAISLSLEIEETGGAEFSMDSEMLHTITANLVSNGIKFSAEGSTVHIHLRIEETELRLEVEDKGVGIRTEDQTLIFERFRQVETGSSRTHQGQGLGLSVVQALVDLLGGHITVSSQPGEGSRFTCALPRQEALDPNDTLSLDGNLFFFGDDQEA